MCYRNLFTFTALVLVGGVGASITDAQTVIYVDDDAPNDPGPGDPTVSDPDEDGSLDHPYDSIREAVDATLPGDVVVVKDGLYAGAPNRLIGFGGKAITVRSENGPENCIVDGEHVAEPFYFYQGETGAARLEGLTIISGPARLGITSGCVKCVDSSPTIVGCTLSGGLSGGITYEGNINALISKCTISGNAGIGAALLDDGSLTIWNSTVSGNAASGVSTGDLHALAGSLTIVNSVIHENGFYGVQARGNSHVILNSTITESALVGIKLQNDAIVQLRNCTIAANGLAGVVCNGSSSARIYNSIVWGHDDEMSCPDSAVSYSDVFGGWEPPEGPGNTNADPLLVDPDNGDYRLSSGSPCIDAADNWAAPLDLADLDGDGDTDEPAPFDVGAKFRFQNDVNTPDTGIGRPPIMDMGAHEYQDCNHNEQEDSVEILGETAPDCNENGIPDSCDIGEELSDDCSGDGVPNECETDCDGNAVPDICEWRDCNTNETLDVCDIAAGTSFDLDLTGVPDACECPPGAPRSGPDIVARNRYLTVTPGTPGQHTALRVIFVDMPAPFEDFEGWQMWVGQPWEVCENSGEDVPPPNGCGPAPGLPGLTFWAAQLGCSSHYADWSTFGTVHVYHPAIVPGAVFQVQAIDDICMEGEEIHYSAPAEAGTSVWGDVVEDCTGCPCSAPEGTINVVTDVVSLVNKFENLDCAVQKTRADIQPGEVDFKIDITDVVQCLGAFTGDDYPFTAPFPPCP